MDVGLAIESPDTTVQYNMWSNEDICRQLDEHCLSKSNNEQLHEESSYELCRKELHQQLGDELHVPSDEETHGGEEQSYEELHGPSDKELHSPSDEETHGGEEPSDEELHGPSDKELHSPSDEETHEQSDEDEETHGGEEQSDEDEETHGGEEQSDEELHGQTDQEESTDGNDVPLYPGAAITVKVALLLLLAFVVRHNLTKEAINDLLYLIDLLCPKPNKCCKSAYRFKKFFSFLIIPAEFKYYCQACIVPINYPLVKICSICKTVFSLAKSPSYFVKFSISNQIKSLFAKETFLNDIQYRFTRTKRNIEQIEDIYDGLLYKKMMAAGEILSDKNNLSLTWNVDGVPLFKSSKFSLWPFYLVVNELPIKLRAIKENVILAGLWFGETKPNMTIFLKPIFSELRTLETEGIQVTSPLQPDPFMSKVILLAGTCDLPAKCMVMNSIQFNGFFGCSKCLQPGISYQTSARGHTQVYPFCSSNPNGPRRTKTQHHSDAKKAVTQGSIVNGIKGPSWLMSLRYYNIIDGTAVDYMHCVLLGVTKLLLSLWFNSEHSTKPFYIGRSVTKVDQRLEGIKPPSCITRKPRALSKHRKYYKASEYRALLLYYSLPVLSGILPQQYWDHHALLVIAVYTLLQQSISLNQLECCQTMLNQYCFQFSSLYSTRYMSANIHLLLHLPDTVKQLGPLWAYSCFHYEGQNGVLKTLIHGTQQADKQLISSYSYIRNLPSAASNLINQCTSLHFESFKHLYFKHSIPQHNSMKISKDIYLIGKPTDIITEAEVIALSVHGYEQCTKFSRLLFRDFQIHSCEWKKNNRQRNNSAVAYHMDNGVIEYGITQGFFLVENSASPVVYVTVTKLAQHDSVTLQMQSHPGWKIPHIAVCVPPSSSCPTIAIPLDHICSPCVFISFGEVKECVYLAVIVNLLEKD